MSETEPLLRPASSGNLAGAKVLALGAMIFVIVIVCGVDVVRRSTPLYETESLSKTAKSPGRRCPGDAGNSLRLVEEHKVAEMLDRPGKYEASAISADGKQYFVVFDSLWEIGVLPAFPLSEGRSFLSGPSDKSKQSSEDSGFEALVLDRDSRSCYAIRESISTKTGFHAIVQRLKFNPSLSEYTLAEECPSEYEFDTGNKGFEGSVGVYHDGELLLLGLCEGNFCAGGHVGRKTGNGRVVVMSKQTSSRGCVWSTVHVMDIPPAANFQDYSAISLGESSGAIRRVAIVSQENSAMFLGRLHVSGPVQDWFISGESGDINVVEFPKDENCETAYCNVEGVDFLADNRFVFASDKAKRDQPGPCRSKDQSVHVFELLELP